MAVSLNDRRGGKWENSKLRRWTSWTSAGVSVEGWQDVEGYVWDGSDWVWTNFADRPTFGGLHRNSTDTGWSRPSFISPFPGAANNINHWARGCIYENKLYHVGGAKLTRYSLSGTAEKSITDQIFRAFSGNNTSIATALTAYNGKLYFFNQANKLYIYNPDTLARDSILTLSGAASGQNATITVGSGGITICRTIQGGFSLLYSRETFDFTGKRTSAGTVSTAPIYQVWFFDGTTTYSGRTNNVSGDRQLELAAQGSSTLKTTYDLPDLRTHLAFLQIADDRIYAGIQAIGVMEMFRKT